MNQVARWGALLICSVLFAFGAAGVAGAQEVDDPYVGPSPTVDSEVVERGVPTDAEAPEVRGAAVSAAASTGPAPEVQGSTLAFTGGDVLVLVLVGAAAVAGGGAILMARRRATA